MEITSKWQISDEEKNKYISALTPELILLRTKAEISQEELANIVGISRQTYGSIERKMRQMTWNTYLSLIMFYDYNKKTHDMIHTTGLFPYELIKRFNDCSDPTINMNSFFNDDMSLILDQLDDQALHSIKTMIMIEYARCKAMPGEAVVKSFDGVGFANNSKQTDKKTMLAFKNLKEREKSND